jgi:regulator of nucleoside diphosphate kinase
MTCLTSRIGSEPDIQITLGNRERLGQVLADHAPIRSWRAVEFLVRELMRASVVSDDEIASDVVTMRSRVTFRSCDGASETVTLVYPGESHLYEDALSVLTPLGAALLGLSKGQAISFPKPQGGMRTITVLDVASQPEAARRSTLSAGSRGKVRRRV